MPARKKSSSSKKTVPMKVVDAHPKASAADKVPTIKPDIQSSPASAPDSKLPASDSAQPEPAAASPKTVASQSEKLAATASANTNPPATNRAAPGAIPADTPPPPPAPLVVTTYNQDRVKRSLVVMGLAIVVGLGVLGWFSRDALQLWRTSTQQRLTQPWVGLQPETVDQAKLAQIPEANQASTPAEATAAPNLRPAYYDQDWAKQSTPELFAALFAAQQSLYNAKIQDRGSIQASIVQAQKAQQAGDEDGARDYLINGLQLAKELTMLHEYYQKQ